MKNIPNEILAVIIAGHSSHETLQKVATMFQQTTGVGIVEAADMETLEQAFERCAKQGATMIIVHPYFLLPGKHATIDIPKLAATAAEKYGVKCRVTEPLGADEAIVKVIERRIVKCLETQ